jgi:hypothetical protein
VDPQEAFATLWLVQLTNLTRRVDEAIKGTHRIRQLSSDPFYLTALYSTRAWAHLGRGDLAAASEAMREGLAEGARPNDMRAIGALLAAHDGRSDEARDVVRELCNATGHFVTSQILIAAAALRIGELEMASKAFNPTMIREFETAARLDPSLHAILDRAPFAPRRRDAVLVWPLEAPMMDASVHRLFREVRIESGLPPSSAMR